MDFIDKIKQFSERAKALKENILTEEATKTSLIMPFFQILGYDVFNPNEFTPEYVADVGIKKGEKVDYAIKRDGKPIILIEAKSINETLTKHDSQLFRYFATSSAKFAILTNGINYRFYTDLEQPNVMDNDPFFSFDMLDFSESQIIELQKFHRDNFEESKIIDTAEELKYLGQIKEVLKKVFADPSDDFVRFVLNSGVYDGVKTSSIIDKYRPIIKRSITSFLNEQVNAKIQGALQNEKPDNSDEAKKETTEVSEQNEEKQDNNGIVTTEEELECLYIVKAILRNNIDVSRIKYKDTRSYFSIIIDGKVTKWVCHIYLRDKVKYFTIPTPDKKERRIDINTPDDIFNYSSELIARLNDLV